MNSAIVLLGIAFVLLVFLMRSIKIVPQKQVKLIERLGKYHRTAEAGLNTIVPFLEHTFGFQFMDADVYYITAIPSEVRWSNVLVIALAALTLTALATVYPALRAARTAPAEALRYE